MGWVGRAAPRDFSQALPSGNPSEQPWEPLGNPVHPSYFNWINSICHLLLNWY